MKSLIKETRFLVLLITAICWSCNPLWAQTGSAKYHWKKSSSVSTKSLSDGDLDTSFNSDGKVTADFGSFGQVRDIVIQSNGKIVAGGFNGSGMFAMRFNSNGSIDNSYGTNGIASAGINQSYKTLIQPDNKVILVGYDGSNIPTAARLDTSGALDASFGTNGVAILNALGGGYCYGASLQSDGKILLTSRSYNGSNYDVVIARLNSNGSLDTSFNGSGYISVDFGNWEDSYGVAQQSDGKIIFSGASTNIGNDFRYLAIGRLKSDGTLDSTGFGTNGKVLTLYGASVSVGPWNIYEQSDSKIVVSGYSDSKFLLSRYDASGNLDTGFNGTGKNLIDFGNTSYGYAVAFQSDGKIVISGSSDNGTSYDFSLARVKTNGIIDSTFGTNGKVITDFGGGDYAYTVKIQSDGKIVLAGYTGSQTAALARYYVQEAAPTVPTVTAISPIQNELNILTNQAINITFSESMDPSTITSENIHISGSISGNIGGGFGFANSNSIIAYNVSPDYFPGEIVTVTITTGVKSAAGVALEYPYSWSFTVKSGTATASLVQNNLQIGEVINNGPSDVNISDVDHDGDADLVWTYFGYSKFMVSLNNGSGTFAPPVSYSGVRAKMGYTVDLNNDGYPDYVGLTQKSTVDSLHVFLNNSDGTFTFSNKYSIDADNYYGLFTVGDVDEDGYPDLISTQNYTNKIVVLKNNGDGTFASAVSFNSNNRPRGITTGDVNSDGFSDIVVVNDVDGTDSVTVLFNNGSGAFTASDEYSLGGDKTPVGVTVADLNNDGELDIATANAVGDISVLLNNGNGIYASAVIYSTVYGRIYIKTTDLNGDGYLDLISSGGNVYRQLLNNGNGTFGTAVGGNIATASGNLDAGDLNGDGAIDVAYTDGGSWYAKLMMNTPTTVPVEMATFSAVAAENKINLSWSTVTETNNTGWEIESRQLTMDKGQQKNTEFKKVGFVAGKGTTTEKQNYSFTVSGLQSSISKAEFRLKQIDADGKFEYSKVLSVELKPEVFSLSQNYPNPFNPATVINYSLPIASHVELSVYNMLGQKIMTLVNGDKEAGYHAFSFDGKNLASGSYFYILNTGNFHSVKKFMLMK